MSKEDAMQCGRCKEKGSQCERCEARQKGREWAEKVWCEWRDAPNWTPTDEHYRGGPGYPGLGPTHPEAWQAAARERWAELYAARKAGECNDSQNVQPTPRLWACPCCGGETTEDGLFRACSQCAVKGRAWVGGWWNNRGGLEDVAKDAHYHCRTHDRADKPTKPEGVPIRLPVDKGTDVSDSVWIGWGFSAWQNCSTPSRQERPDDVHATVNPTQSVDCPRCGQASTSTLDGMPFCGQCKAAHKWLKPPHATAHPMGDDEQLRSWRRMFPARSDLATPYRPPYRSRPCPCGLGACMCDRNA